MKKIEVSTLKELSEVLESLVGPHLFRGQVKDYFKPGQSQFEPSMKRLGCAPPQMLKWSWIARETLLRFGVDQELVLEGKSIYCQAMMQHYGWRSFFLDVSGNPRVAAWFSSNSFSPQAEKITFSEDANERPVVLGFHESVPVVGKGTGNLFCFSKEEILSAGHSLVNLKESGMERPRRQCAWALSLDGKGSLEEGTPSAIQIVAPIKVLEQYSKGGEYSSVESLFPSVEEDNLYRVLLFWPWEFVASTGNLPFFRHELGLPIYPAANNSSPWNPENLYHCPDELAFMEPNWLGTAYPNEWTKQIRVESYVFCMGDVTGRVDLRPLLNYLGTNDGDSLIVESDKIVRHLNEPFGTQYSKGAVIKRVERNVISVHEVSVDYVGRQPQGVKGCAPLFYQIDEKTGLCRIVKRQGSCPCKDERRHRLHLDFLTVVGDLLEDGRLRKNLEGHYSMEACCDLEEV